MDLVGAKQLFISKSTLIFNQVLSFILLGWQEQLGASQAPPSLPPLPQPQMSLKWLTNGFV